MLGIEDAVIEGVRVVSLRTHPDARGTFTELFRETWPTGIEPVQWNVVRSRPHVLRGVHVHPCHADYLSVVAGTMLLALHDIRPDAVTFGASQIIELSGDALAAVMIPPGVAHGFYFPVESMHVYATSHYWNVAEELGCRWDCPELGLAWEIDDPLLSERDQSACSYADMIASFRAAKAGA